MAKGTETNIVDFEETSSDPNTKPTKTTIKKQRKRKISKVKTLNKNSIETFKTIVLTILITAAVAFPLGMNYQSQQQAKVDAATEKAVQSLKQETPPKQ